MYLADFNQKRPISYGIAATKQTKEKSSMLYMELNIGTYSSSRPALSIHRNDDGVASFSSRKEYQEWVKRKSKRGAR